MTDRSGVTARNVTSSHSRRGDEFAAFVEETARQLHELALRWMVDRFPNYDLRPQGELLDLVAKVARVRARHHDRLDACQCIADLGEEFVFAAHPSAVLACVAKILLDLLVEDLLGVDLQHLSGVVVDPADGVAEWRGKLLVMAHSDASRMLLEPDRKTSAA